MLFRHIPFRQRSIRVYPFMEPAGERHYNVFPLNWVPFSAIFCDTYFIVAALLLICRVQRLRLLFIFPLHLHMKAR